ncbi:MAG: stage III sporulation protein AF [Sporolactobacillus sp.]
MSYLENWVSQLVIIVLFAVILELLLPSGGYQKYVKLVVGLVLIVALMDPVIRLFHLDPQDLIRGIQIGQGSGQLETETNTQKKEIEKQQRAYIQKQVVVQMKNRVKEELNKRYGLQIEKMELSAKQDNPQEMSLKKVTIVLGKFEPSGHADKFPAIQPVQPVSINIGSKENSGSRRNAASRKTDKIRSLLAERWQIHKQIISIQFEGGD